MPSSTVENYIKRIYLAHPRDRCSRLPMGHLARIMEVVPGTATSMVKTLAESGLVDYEPRSGVRLTEEGTTLALHVLRRHRLVEQFLVEKLNLDWSEVHEEAEALEHVVSDKVLESMDRVLGHPAFDPHGDPIPTASGAVADSAHEQLSGCAADSRVRIARILDQDPSFLQFIEEHGLVPGRRVIVRSNHPQADSVVLEDGDARTITLGTGAAAKILVDKV